QQIHSDLLHGKELKTQHVVQAAAGVLQHFQAQEAAGTLPREDAQKQAMQAIRALRYDKNDYFWINDLT
ncbi:cache domain-containing protein, partial [Escherichia coli]|nr:cache domain-containing protein [Escherichia coli]